MSDSKRFIFSIDALRPDTLSMKALSKYLSELAELIGEDSAIHFDRVQEGSAELLWWPEQDVEEKVRTRLQSIDDFTSHRDIHEAVLKLNKRLANDNASAKILDPQRQEIASFLGRKFESFKDVPAFWQEDTLQGILIRIGGKDDSIHAHLDMGGKVITQIEFNKELAREAVKHFLGPTIRLNGKARWRRDYLGDWNLIKFKVHSFDVLDDSGLEETIDKIGSFLREGIQSSIHLYETDEDSLDE